MSMIRTDHTWSWIDDALPFVVMLMVSSLDMAVLTIVKAAMNNGMESIVYVVYHNALGTLILFPFFIVHILSDDIASPLYRKVDRPPLTFHILFRFFILRALGLGLFEVLWYTGVDYSSPNMASAISNLSPGLIFLIAVFFRMEKIDIRSPSSLAKLLGTMTAILGTMVFTLYQGPTIFHADVLSTNTPNHLFLSQPSKWIFGSLILLIGVIFACMWSVLQTKTIKEYPDQQSIVFFFCLFGTIQCLALSPFLERSRSAWVIQPGIGMTAITLGAVYSVVFRISALSWCLEKKGPTFVAMFSPISIVIAMIMGITFLGDSLHLGRVIRATIVVIGFYIVRWGQSKEKKKTPMVMDDDLDISAEHGSTTHLLSSRNAS